MIAQDQMVADLLKVALYKLFMGQAEKSLCVIALKKTN
jgi:hypothetical protein